MKRKTDFEIMPGSAETITSIPQLMEPLKDYIMSICQKENIDINNIPFSQWEYIIYMIGSQFMKDYIYLFKKPYNGSILQWDLNSICVSCTTLYIPLCRLYKQKVYVSVFCEFIGLNQDILYRLIDRYIDTHKNNNNACDNNINSMLDDRQPDALSVSPSDLLKYIHVESEKSLSNLMQSSKGNQIGFLSELNFRFGWTKPEIEKNNKRLSAKSMESLPELGIIDESQE